MSKNNSPIITVLPNFVACILFFMGAFRFYMNTDHFGATLFTAAGIIFGIVGFINLGKLKKKL